MDNILELVRNVTIFMLFSNCAISLIDSSEYKKILRLFLGLVLIVMILGKVICINDIDFDNIFVNEEREQVVNELKNQMQSNEEYIYENAKKEYVRISKEEIGKICEQEGYYANECQIEFDANTNISNISIELNKNAISVLNVQEVKIGEKVQENSKKLSSEEKIIEEKIKQNIYAIFGNVEVKLSFE